jgi:hypothetical protein
MSTQPSSQSSRKVQIAASTALKAGFFGALGVFLFYLIISVVLGVVALVLAVALNLDPTNWLPFR